jgi:hypothetical protein
MHFRVTHNLQLCKRQSFKISGVSVFAWNVVGHMPAPEEKDKDARTEKEQTRKGRSKAENEQVCMDF